MITSRTRIVALMGDPVGHSMSPQMHNAWIADHGLDAAYVAVRAPREHADAIISGMQKADFHGLNVTIPHKETAARLADVLTQEARLFGAANILSKGANGRWTGHNTDPHGVLASLDEAAPQWRGQTQRALVIGAGGAGRAIALALGQAGIGRVDLVNRTRARADDVVAAIGGAGLAARDWFDLPAAFADADLIINASSLGMAGSPATDWPIASAKPHAVVFDAVYTPLETPLLAAAKARGLTTVDGLGMLIHQGARAFEIWFGVSPDTKKARARLLAILAGPT